jgi:2'-5' RNA ligase
MTMTVFLEKTDGIYKYSCLMWAAPTFYKDLIISWGKTHIPDNLLYTDPEDPSLGREDDQHVTVKYGIHTKDPTDVQEVVKDFGHFLIEFGEISKFSKKDLYDVIKISIDGKKLRKLNELVSAELECTDTYKEYNPHLTIAYVTPGSCDHLLGKYIFRDCAIKADQLLFSIANDEKPSEKVTIDLK